MARGAGDDEYQELQKRFATLENERKNLFEHTQLEVKKNKKILGDLKSDNKKLRSDLSNLMSDQGKNTNSSEVSRLEKQAADLRRQYDDTKHKLAMRQKQVDSMQDKMRDLEKDIAKLRDDDTPLTRNIRTLENRLDKAMIKYNEAQSIHKTYEQIVKRLKEERIGFDNQLAAIERTLKAKEKDLGPVVMAGVIGIYGFIIAVVVGTKIKEPTGGGTSPAQPQYTLFSAFGHLGSGLTGGLSGLAAGMAIGIVGDAGVRATAQQPKLFVGMILILIFAEALGLYGLIVALIMSSSGGGSCPSV